MIVPLVDDETWLRTLSGSLAWIPPHKNTVVIAPHPDDETLSVAGLVAKQCRRGLSVSVIAVTDGEAAYGNSRELAVLRRHEQEEALKVLGVSRSSIVRIGLPDSKVSNYEEQLVKLLIPLLLPQSLVVAPWSSDWHPDHEACGRAAEAACRAVGAELISYLFWTWHCKTAESVSALNIVRFELDDWLQRKKRQALSRHESQLKREDGDPILPESLLWPARRSFESFIIHG